MSDDENVYEWLSERGGSKRFEPRPNSWSVPVKPHAGTIIGGPFDGADFEIGFSKKTHDMTGQEQWRVWTGPYTMSIKKQYTESGSLWTVRVID